MPDNNVYKSIEVTGSSSASVEDAVQTALAKAAKTIRDMNWFQILETKGYVETNAISYWQVTIKISFTVE